MIMGRSASLALQGEAGHGYPFDTEGAPAPAERRALALLFAARPHYGVGCVEMSRRRLANPAFRPPATTVRRPADGRSAPAGDGSDPSGSRWIGSNLDLHPKGTSKKRELLLEN